MDKETEYLMTLKPAERLVYDTRKLATKSISPGLYDILDTNELLPTDPTDSAFEYICVGNINRRIDLRYGEPSSVFILLGGSIQVCSIVSYIDMSKSMDCDVDSSQETYEKYFCYKRRGRF